MVAVVYSLILSLFFYKSIKLSDIPKLLIDSAETTGIIIFLIGVSGIMSWVMAFTNIPGPFPPDCCLSAKTRLSFC